MKGRRMRSSHQGVGPGVNKSSLSGHPQMSTAGSKPRQEVEEDYISNLQKQIYYLELEMKLMKDREVETKNKVGGYEVLFRDGVPLNEHFLALKTKYTKEKEKFETYIRQLNEEIREIENENKTFENQIDESNNNYYEFTDKHTQNSDYYSKHIFDLNCKLISEKNSKASHLQDKELMSKRLYKISSENVHHKRTLEKNKLFQESKEEKNRVAKEKAQEKFAEVDKLVLRSLLEKENIERKLQNNSEQKQVENKNAELLNVINKLERDKHMTMAKVEELENTRTLNKKYLMDEQLNLNIYEKENKRLNEELDSLVKINEENMKQKVKENERNQAIVIQNSIRNSEFQMGLLLEKFKQEEGNARELLEEKNSLQQKIAASYEVIENQKEAEAQAKRDLIDVRNQIDELETLVEEKQGIQNNIQNENERMKQTAGKYETEIKHLKKKMEEIKQKIELNSILKDIDISELKMLSQNNALVNNSINTLISKWDKVHSKLNEMGGGDLDTKENDI